MVICEQIVTGPSHLSLSLSLGRLDKPVDDFFMQLNAAELVGGFLCEGLRSESEVAENENSQIKYKCPKIVPKQGVHSEMKIQ